MEVMTYEADETDKTRPYRCGSARLISGGGVTVLTNNAMTHQIDQMAAEYGIDLNTAETGQMLTNTFKSSYAKACGVLSQFGIVPEDIAKKAAKEAANFSAEYV